MLTHCKVPFNLYKVPSSKFHDYVPALKRYPYGRDRWSDNLDPCLQRYGNKFIIDAESVYLNRYEHYTSLAEIYHILHVDKRINSFINVRYNKKSYKIEPGVKRSLLLEHLPFHDVPVVVFNGKLKHLKPQTQITGYELLDRELGPELRNSNWDNILKDKLSKELIEVYIDSRICVMNDITFFERESTNDKWKIVYK
jgi:virulence-associated protein VapD